jgi:hypothetical protein
MKIKGLFSLFFFQECDLTSQDQNMPITVAARSKTSDVFGRSNTGIVGSNPTRSTDVCQRFSVFVLSCVGSGLATGLITRPRGPAVYKIQISELINSDWTLAREPNPSREK